MKIEITKGCDNPVSEFFSSPSKTPETDAALYPMNVDIVGEIRLLEERIEEALKELSSIHQWIDRNHPDGFIDSLTYLQNLERVTDNWYDRLDRLEVDAKRFVRERDEARHKLELCMAANSDVARIAKERDEARDDLIKSYTKIKDLESEIRGVGLLRDKSKRERDEAREQIKELIYIAERAIDLAEIDFENDKFGVVSELRDGVERIKEGAK